MEEVYEISQYFPRKTASSSLSNYIDHHLTLLHSCVENELFSSAYVHLHILYMVLVYIQLFRISKEKAIEFNLCWIGFPNQEKDFLKNPSSPFSFSSINEKSVFRFFRLVGFSDGIIGDISSLVKKRNDSLHANGIILFKDSNDFEKELGIYIKKMNKIIEYQVDFIKDLYYSIIKNFDTDYKVSDDDIETNLVIPYFFSEHELRIISKGKDDVISMYIIENII